MEKSKEGDTVTMIEMSAFPVDPVFAGFGHMRDWGMAGLGLLIMLAVVALVAGLVIFLVRSAGPSSSSAMPETRPSKAREHLDERYARGEIAREKYLQMREDLES